jgi:hypothetical protein
MLEPAKVFEGRVKQHRMHPTGSKPHRSTPLMAAGVLIALGAALLFVLGQ